MSTHASIIFLDTDINNINFKEIKPSIIFDGKESIYIHCDGYIEGVLKWLCPFLQLRGSGQRQSDSNYLIGWCISYYLTKTMTKYLMRFKADSLEKEWKQRENYIFNINDFEKLTDLRGAGIYNLNEIWSEFLYIVTPNYGKEEANFNIYVYDDNNKFLGCYNETIYKE